LLCGAHRDIATAKENVDAGIDDLRHYFLVPFRSTAKTASVDGEISTLDETLPAQPIEQRRELRRRSRQLMQNRKPIDTAGLLGSRRQRPRRRGAAERAKKLSPPHVSNPRHRNGETIAL
jgi:hypothetical protein